MLFTNKIDSIENKGGFYPEVSKEYILEPSLLHCEIMKG